MSQSPLDATPPAAEEELYLRNWNRLAQLIREGHSFSGRERNCCFLNTGRGRFADVSAASGLDFPDDGRGLAVVDWDHDGDLDFWVANRTAPSVRCLLNCTNDSQRRGFIALQLQGTRCNRDAIGARVELVIADESEKRIRTLRAGEGFLSQSSKWIHFGLGSATQIQEVRVRWPGDTDPEVFRDIQVNQRYRLVQDSGAATRVTDRPTIQLHNPPSAPEPATLPPRVVLTQHPKLQEFRFQDAQGSTQTLNLAGRDQPLLVTLWASWCQPCVAEMNDLTANASTLRHHQLDVLALCVDAVSDKSADPEASSSLIDQLQWPFRWGMATRDGLHELAQIDQQIFYRIKPLPLPCSYLFDAQGRLAIIYKGQLQHEQLLQDVALLSESAAQRLQAALPCGGKNVVAWFSPDELHVAQAFLEGGYLDDADSILLTYLQDLAARANKDRAPQQVQGYRLLARIARLRSNSQAQTAALRQVVDLVPEDPRALIELAMALPQQADAANEAEQLFRRAEQLAGQGPVVLLLLGQARLQRGQTEAAIDLLQRACASEPTNQEARFGLALAYQSQGALSEALALYRSILAAAPDFHEAANNLAWLLATQPNASEADFAEAVRLAEELCRRTGQQNASYLDTLSVVLSAAHQEEQSEKAADAAFAAARARGDTALMEKLKRRRPHSSPAPGSR